MTTTLRPTAPLKTTDDGERRCTYEVCVNSRPVGVLELSTDAKFGASHGQIQRLDIDEPDRRRGRATVAALAAEEVLRGWGCVQVRITVPIEARAALTLAGDLGYTTRGHNMVKDLTVPPVLPPASVSRAMTETEFPSWLARERAGYTRSWVERGSTEEQAAAKADADFTAYLPNGPATPSVRLRVLTHEGADRGDIWISLGDAYGEDVGAYVFSVEVAPEHRGQGHGRSLLLIAEQESLAAGARSIGLHVFADNTPAMGLYESLNYRYTRTHLFKAL
ncbi:GNAT family N-acetyltransferase [Streptomyces zagrosensis]|uniref:Ribosomal protein S18 acetylase RimI-like enzyme n=1 Tax=Streptomyces zagrosensis TaxID=1042984 RepID=A0A7W9UYH0_9ACTN|nr:GNAT family N-acetyltransferase [Streptomyces zagrosensis]MBB5935657.1 ribosomal protein S18 acetylase RimI-like enzyme [Streptomyces zagrosensis]